MKQLLITIAVVLLVECGVKAVFAFLNIVVVLAACIFCAEIGCTDEGKKSDMAKHFASAIGTSEYQVGFYSLIIMVVSFLITLPHSSIKLRQNSKLYNFRC